MAKSNNKKHLTLCLVFQYPNVLLGMKKRGFGMGKWNGFGGKVNEDESIREAAIREIKEEAGIEVKDLIKMGIIDFEFKGNTEIAVVHIFKSENFVGNPTESEEMRPQWFEVGEIPFDQMWADNKYWFPMFFEGKKFKGRFLFEGENIIEYALSEVANL